MIDPVVRPASERDLGEIARLEELARAALVRQRGGDRWLATHAPHGGAPGADSLIWVATIDDVVVGYLVCSIADGLARVIDVFVHPGAREVGFGDELLAAAVETSRAEGAVVLEAEALPGDRATKNLYERAGITARLITVSTPL